MSNDHKNRAGKQTRVEGSSHKESSWASIGKRSLTESLGLVAQSSSASSSSDAVLGEAESLLSEEKYAAIRDAIANKVAKIGGEDAIKRLRDEAKSAWDSYSEDKGSYSKRIRAASALTRLKSAYESHHKKAMQNAKEKGRDGSGKPINSPFKH